MSKKTQLPAVSSDGQVMSAVGKYARGMVMAVFEDIGGREAMAEWAEENKGEFYTKLFPKIITRETEQVRETESVEDLLDVVDAEVEEVKKNAVDAEYEDM